MNLGPSVTLYSAVGNGVCVFGGVSEVGTGREGWDRGIQGTFLSNFARAQYDNQDGKLERQVRKMRKYIAGYRLYTYSLYVLSLKLWHNQAKYRPNRTQKTTQGLGKSGGRGGGEVPLSCPLYYRHWLYVSQCRDSSKKCKTAIFIFLWENRINRLIRKPRQNCYIQISDVYVNGINCAKG